MMCEIPTCEVCGNTGMNCFCAEPNYPEGYVRPKAVITARAEIAWSKMMLEELSSEISRHHRDFEYISNLCEQVRNEELSAEQALKKIQNIVG